MRHYHDQRTSRAKIHRYFRRRRFVFKAAVVDDIVILRVGHFTWLGVPLLRRASGFAHSFSTFQCFTIVSICHFHFYFQSDIHPRCRIIFNGPFEAFWRLKVGQTAAVVTLVECSQHDVFCNGGYFQWFVCHDRDRAFLSSAHRVDLGLNSTARLTWIKSFMHLGWRRDCDHKRGYETESQHAWITCQQHT